MERDDLGENVLEQRLSSSVVCHCRRVVCMHFYAFLVAVYPLLQVRGSTRDGWLPAGCRLTSAMKRATADEAGRDEAAGSRRRKKGGWDEGAAAPFTPITGCGLPRFLTPGDQRPWEQVPKMQRDPLALEPRRRSRAGRLTPRIICQAPFTWATCRVGWPQSPCSPRSSQGP
jgi:hypothetical protein